MTATKTKFDESAPDVSDRPAISDRFDGLTQHSREAASIVSDATDKLSTRLPDAATKVDRLMRSSSDETLRIVAAAAVGLAAGLMIAGANRLVIVVSLIPAAVIGLALSGRRSV